MSDLTLFDIEEPDTDNHPCPMSWPIIHALGPILKHLAPDHVHDPFAGEGRRLADLCAYLGIWFSGTDLVEWRGHHRAVVIGDATNPASYPTGPHIVVTSPTYNNGFGDTYTDNSERHTYTAAARQELGPTNTGRYTGRYSKTGEAMYWKLHDEAVRHWPATVVVNVKDSIRYGDVYPLGDLWCDLLIRHGYAITGRQAVECGGHRKCANGNLRVDDEQVIVAVKTTA